MSNGVCVPIPDCEDDKDKPIRQCVGYEVRNETTGECECERVITHPITGQIHFQTPDMRCDNAWSYEDYSVGVCDCVQVSCPSGQYAKGLNNCQQCPDPGLIATNGNCTVQSDVAKSNIHGGVFTESIALVQYNGCYLPANCSATDETGTFVLSGDCVHSVDNSIAPAPGGEKEFGPVS